MKKESLNNNQNSLISYEIGLFYISIITVCTP